MIRVVGRARRRKSHFAMLFLIVPILVFASCVSAQDGQQLFSLYCAACHGVDGKGATGGTFPPLAGSPYVGGDADRPVKIVLKGLTGPVDVLGKTYNLEMPPQGAMLPDDQVAAILTYVRSAWGNQAGQITKDQVKAIRASVEDRKMPWTAEEILKLHPLPLEKTALSNLTSQTYEGDWQAMPDFSKLTAANVEEEHDGILNVDDSVKRDAFALVWQGSFEAPADGEYTFLLDADDAARVMLDGNLVAEVKGVGPLNGARAEQGKIKLSRGPHAFRTEYLEYRGHQAITLGWQAPGEKRWRWLSNEKPRTTELRTLIPIEPAGNRPVIYRNFIFGTTPRGIGVGFPGGFNLAYSADNLQPELIWTGKFMDGSFKWFERGTDNSPPAGENLVKLGSNRYLPADARFRGYKLDSNGNPTFVVAMGDQILTDSWKVENGALLRTLSINRGSPLEIVISDHGIGDKISVDTDDGAVKGASRITLTPGKSRTLIYRWK